MHDMWRRVERLTVAEASARAAAMAVARTKLVWKLLELIAALDRRVPQGHRPSEASIARDAAALKALALKRLAELEYEAGLVEQL